jgi:o-succinylbenzoate---CoA ligase
VPIVYSEQVIRISGRALRAVAVPRGIEVLDLLQDLRAALAGDGPALLPHGPGPDDGPDPSLGPGLPLGPREDDETDPTVAVLRTSGSTGPPRGALLQASALLAAASACHDRLGGPGRWLLALPAHHVAGFQILVRSLVARTTPVVQDLSAGFAPEGFVRATERLHGPRRYTALVPTQLIRLMEGGPQVVRALAGLDAVLLGGAAAPPGLLRSARGHGIRVVTTYGMSETCGGCVYDGTPLDGVRIALGDLTGSTDRTGPPDGPGAASDLFPDAGCPGEGEQVRIGGPVVARGYRRPPEDSLPGPRPPLPPVPPPAPERDTGGGSEGDFHTTADGTRWFRTRDLARWVGTGPTRTLEVLGRLDDLIITGGLKVSPGAVEAAILTDPGIAQAVVFGVPDPQWGQRVVAAVVPAAGAGGPAPARVRDLGATVGRFAAPRQVLVLDRLPLRGPGKPDRRALLELARARPLHQN